MPNRSVEHPPPREVATRILAYVSGPFSQGSTNDNVRKAILLGDELYQLSDGKIAPQIPHLNHLWELVTGARDYQIWMDVDFVLLSRCDVNIRLPGYSPGADAEERFCDEAGIPVYHVENFQTNFDLVQWVISQTTLERLGDRVSGASK